MVEVGQPVTYIDSTGATRPALVTAIHGSSEGPGLPSINLVIVCDDETRRDQYGRQIERSTSVVHESHQAAHGNYWR